MTLHAVSSSSSRVNTELVLGRTEPRLSTPPLRDVLNDRSASYGYAVIDFARNILRTPLDPWEEHAVIRGGELKHDGITPRFRKVLIIVARQQGKTYMVRVLTQFWLFVEQWPMVFGMSTTASMAKKQWEIVVREATKNPALSPDVESVTRSKGLETLTTVEGCEYCFGAATEDGGGRSLSIDRLIVDELRKHKDTGPWNAAYLAMNGRPLGQAYCITNQGDLRSVTLRSIRADALRDIQDGNEDGDVCLLEWSAPDKSSPMDLHALAAANPNMNRVGWDGQLRMDQNTVLGQGRQALLAGGRELSKHLTEVLCMEVDALDAAVDPVAWRSGNRESFAQPRSRTVGFIDVSPTQKHVTLCGAVMQVDGKIRVVTLADWEGAGALAAMRADLPGLVAEHELRKLGWVPGNYTAVLGSYLAKLKVPGCEIVELGGEDVLQACMGFSERVLAGEVVHLNDPLLEAHITRAAKYYVGDRWRFTWDGKDDVDAAYAAAGAAHLALTLPKPIRGSISIVRD